MAIDTNMERVYCLSDLSREIAAIKGLEKSHYTLRRWITAGVHTRRETYYLESVKIGNVYHSSLEAFDRFIKAQNRDSESSFF